MWPAAKQGVLRSLERAIGGRFEVSCRIAQIPLAWSTDSAELRDWLQEFFRDYLASTPAPPALRIDASVDRSAPPQFWESEDAEFRGQKDGPKNGVIHRDFVALQQGDRVAARLSPILPDAVHNLLRWALSRELLRQGAVLLHGASVIHAGGAHVFIGPSGAGKSTSVELITRADPGSQAIGDDAVILRRDPVGALCVHSAPLGCGYSRHAPPALSAPLAGLYALRQAPAHDLVQLTLSQRVHHLLVSVMLLEFDRLTLEEALKTVTGIAQFENFYELRFARDPGFWERIKHERLTRRSATA